MSAMSARARTRAIHDYFAFHIISYAAAYAMILLPLRYAAPLKIRRYA